MFESIKHTGSSDGMTTACYVHGDVSGEVIFSSAHKRTVIISEVGPAEQMRECLVIYRFHPVLGFNRPIVKEEFYDYAVRHTTAR
ncbi:hypothetical protein [Pseudomonas tohonis]|uniref:hypothetical protein n=1 Tax=Pseudomonas tohonis TaxID=2725477 RepID=UPI0022F04780|nr:hypothetical protein [Pseudomonas tohonis]